VHHYLVIVMSIGAVRMHRGLADGVVLCGNQAGMIDTKPEEQSTKIAMQFINSSFLGHSEGGKHGAGGDVFPSLPWTMPKVKWFGGKQDDGSQEKESV
jgi:hypothetical protein